MAEVPDLVEKWGEIVKRLVWITFYRLLAIVGCHANVGEMYDVCKWLSKNTPMGGTVEWTVPNRVFFWRRVNVNRDVTINVRVFGSPYGRNTFFTRIGFFKGWTATELFPALRRVLARLFAPARGS